MKLCNFIFELTVLVIYSWFKIYFPIGHHCMVSSIKQNLVLFIHRVIFLSQKRWLFFHQKWGNLPKFSCQQVEKRWKKFHLKFYFLPLSLEISYSTKIGGCVGVWCLVVSCWWILLCANTALPSSNFSGLWFHWMRWNRFWYINNTTNVDLQFILK